MKTRSKSILLFVGGIVTGVILTIVFFFIVALGRSAASNDDIVLYDEPKQEIHVRTFEVMQVFPNGDALARVEDHSNFGMIVLFLAENGTSYYDDQKIEVPYHKKVMQIGTYRYTTRSEMDKTVPIVEIFDRY